MGYRVDFHICVFFRVQVRMSVFVQQLIISFFLYFFPFIIYFLLKYIFYTKFYGNGSPPPALPKSSSFTQVYIFHFLLVIKKKTN